MVFLGRTGTRQARKQSLVKLFEDPIERLSWVELQQVGSVAFPEGALPLFPDHSLAALEAVTVWLGQLPL